MLQRCRMCCWRQNMFCLWKCLNLLSFTPQVPDPEGRLGHPNTGGYAALKAHPFFEGIDWDTIFSTVSFSSPGCARAHTQACPTVRSLPSSLLPVPAADYALPLGLVSPDSAQRAQNNARHKQPRWAVGKKGDQRGRFPCTTHTYTHPHAHQYILSHLCSPRPSCGQTFRCSRASRLRSHRTSTWAATGWPRTAATTQSSRTSPTKAALPTSLSSI